MRILALDCTAAPASCAITDDSRLLASFYCHVKQTHSVTLLPMVKAALENTGLSVGDLDALAVTAGPGSFTGVRIGLAALKGLAAPYSLPCVGLSTLAVMAEAFLDTDCVVCAVMDARRNQVYNALFRIENGLAHRLCDDRAISCEALAGEIAHMRRPVELIVTGDGTDVFFPYVKELKNIRKAGESRRYQSAACCALLAEKAVKEGRTVTAESLLPVYLRLPQAERDLQAKKES